MSPTFLRFRYATSRFAHPGGQPPGRLRAGRFGSESYAAEELVAELGAAFLSAELGLPTDPREDHAPDVANRPSKQVKKVFARSKSRTNNPFFFLWLAPSIRPEAIHAFRV